MDTKYKPYDSRRKIYCKDTKEYCNGKNYLKSLHWKNMRKHIYKKYKGICELCGKKIPTYKANIHHLTYKRFGNELDTDLILYCETCHAKIHHKHKKVPTALLFFIVFVIIFLIFLYFRTHF